LDKDFFHFEGDLKLKKGHQPKMTVAGPVDGREKRL
jgi:hypothetical protein